MVSLLLEKFPFFSSPESVLWQKCLHKEGPSSKRFLHTHHPQIRKNNRNKIKRNHTEGDGISWLQQNRNFVLSFAPAITACPDSYWQGCSRAPSSWSRPAQPLPEGSVMREGTGEKQRLALSLLLPQIHPFVWGNPLPAIRAKPEDQF